MLGSSGLLRITKNTRNAVRVCGGSDSRVDSDSNPSRRADEKIDNVIYLRSKSSPLAFQRC